MAGPGCCSWSFGMPAADCRICCKLNVSYNFYKHTSVELRKAHTQKIADWMEGSLPSPPERISTPPRLTLLPLLLVLQFGYPLLGNVISCTERSCIGVNLKFALKDLQLYCIYFEKSYMSWFHIYITI